jgi:hypothetical protein
MRAAMPGTDGAREFVEHLRSELPRLLREDVEVRGQIIALLSDYLTTRQETAAILAELRQMREDFDRRMDEQGRRIEEQGRRIEEQGRRIEEQGRRIEEQGRRTEEQGQRIDEHTQALAALQRQIMGLGARWGMMTEDAFRRSVAALFADQPQVHVEHWRHHDSAGTVFGYPADVDMDVVVRDGTLVLIEIKSSISGADVSEFSRRAQLYREVTGRQPSRLLMIGPYVDPRACEVADRLGIELVSSVTPPAV